MKRDDTLAWVGGLLVGAAAMYYLDPRSGRRRRALVRDKLVHLAHEAEGSAERVGRDLGNRARGTVARTTRRLIMQPVDDRVLEERVRSALGRLASHPRAIDVRAYDGIVTLGGRVPEDEAGRLLTGLRGVPGLRRVESRLLTVKIPEGARGRPPGDPPTGLTPTAVTLAAVSGAALIWAGGRRRGVPGLAATIIGGYMLYRTAAGARRGGVREGVTGRASVAQTSIEVAAPVAEVFAYWSAFRNFPRFMEHLREVRESEEGVSHWVADGPAGIPVSWDAEITSLQPHRRIAWRSLRGSIIRNAGEVRFEEIGEGATRLHLRMAYHPPAGAVGQVVARFFGADPQRQVEDDLARFKALLEKGSLTPAGLLAGPSEPRVGMEPPPAPAPSSRR